MAMRNILMEGIRAADFAGGESDHRGDASRWARALLIFRRLKLRFYEHI